MLPYSKEINFQVSLCFILKKQNAILTALNFEGKIAMIVYAFYVFSSMPDFES